MPNLAERILQTLQDTPGQRARDLAGELGVEKQEINSHLYGLLSDFVVKDDDNRWSLTENAHAETTSQEDERIESPDEPLTSSSDHGGRWHFREISPDEVETEITQRDQFRNDEVDLSDTVVREAVQNSLDAQKNGEQVIVRFAIADESSGLSAEFLTGLFGGQDQHAAGAGLDPDQVFSGTSPRALVVEDFGTCGLTGNTQLKDNDNFSDFWRRHGKSHKTGKAGGRWGLGKLVYSYSSEIGVFFGLTVRDGDEAPHLMGQTVLNTHVLDGTQYAPHGFFCTLRSEDPQAGLQIPVNDPDLIRDFVDNFSLQRPGRSGLSVVIPYPLDEIQMKRMIAVGVENYFFPILTDQLVLDFDSVRLDRSTVRQVATRFAAEGIDDAEKLFDFVEAAHEMKREQLLHLETDWYQDWKISDDDFAPEVLEELRSRFAAHELIGVTLRVDIKLKDGTITESWFDLYMKTDPALSRGQDMYVRGGITVPGEAKFRHRKALGALVARDDGIAEFLGDAENAAHTKWNGRAEKLTSKYKYAPQTLSAVRNSLVQLHDVLAQVIEEETEDALLDFFWTEGKGAPKRKRGRERSSPPEFPRLPRTIRPVQVRPHKGGFAIAPTSDATADAFPMRIVVEAAYDISSGNPFKKYSHLDFDFSRATGMPVELKNAKLETAAENRLQILLFGSEFRVVAGGFDSERDVIVKIRTQEI